MAGGGQPVTLTVTPLKFTFPHGVHAAVERVTVTNGGQQPITVTARPMDVLAVTGGCGVTPAPRAWMSISRVATLGPGQSRTAVVRLHVPAGVNVDIAAVFTATPVSAGAAGGGHAAAGIGTQFVVNGRGTAAAPVCARHHVQAAPVHNGAGTGLGVILLAAAAVTAVVVACAAISRKLRRT